MEFKTTSQYFEEVRNAAAEMQPLANKLNYLMTEGKKLMPEEQRAEMEKSISSADFSEVQNNLANLTNVLNNFRK
jgi:hypothetical protein